MHESTVEETTDDIEPHATDTNELHEAAESEPQGTVIPDYIVDSNNVEESSRPHENGRKMTDRDENAHR